jgi:transcriptional regulator GlxA family with amidase domain
MSNVAVLVPDRVSVFELAVPCEVFGIDRSDLADPWYGFRTIAAAEPPLATSAGYTLDSPWRLSDLDWADTVIVPAWPGPAPTAVDGGPSWRKVSTAPPSADLPGEILDALRAAHERGARTVGICTGAFVLAAAGLLDGRRATTHWLHARTFATRFPAVKVDPDVLYVDEGQVLTSAGTSAGIDLCLHILRLDHGADVANDVARRMVCPPHRDGGQAQYIDQPLPRPESEAPIASLLDWMQDHLDQPLTVDDLADRCAMSTRTFARKFRAATGTTPQRWLSRQRVRRAQQLLETSDHNVDVIADRCGLGSAANLRKHLRRVTGTTPSAYRDTFNAA